MLLSMRRALDFLGLTRSERAPRPRALALVVGGIGLFLVLLGVAVIAGTASVGTPAAAVGSRRYAGRTASEKNATGVLPSAG
jgi:hypothetical protein